MKEEKTMQSRGSNIKYKIALVVAIVVILALAAVILIPPVSSQDTGDKEKATSGVTEVFSLLTDSNVEVLSSKYENGIYKFVLRITDRLGNSNVQDIFVTKDGQYMTNTLIDLQAYRLRLAKEKDFVSCLFNKGVRIVGLSNNSASILQVQALGTFGSMLYFDCSGDNLKVCQDIGVKSLPSVIYNNTIYEGLKAADWFVTATGCTI